MTGDIVLFVRDPRTGLIGIFSQSRLDAEKVSCVCGKGKLRKDDTSNGYFCPVCKRTLKLK